MDFTYSFVDANSHNNGNAIQITNNKDGTRTQQFTYDQVNRILTGKTNATSGSNCWGESFTYDQWANLTSIGAVSGYTGCTHEMLSVTASSSTNQLSITGVTGPYDSSGNMLKDGSYIYTYDAENHILSASGMSGGPWSYVYDGNGLRVEKSNSAGGTLYWRAITGETIAETDTTGSTTNSAYKEYVFFAGRRIASHDGLGNVNYFYTDHLGSITTITDGSGNACYQATFTPYGEEHALPTNTCSSNYKFTGFERDSETGIDYAFARYYNSRLGRFMSADPLGGDIGDPQSLNRYAYVRNSPTSLIDPLGLKLPCTTSVKSDPSGVLACGAPAPDSWFMAFIASWGDYDEGGGWHTVGLAMGISTGVGGPQQCTLNIQINNKAGMSPDSLSGIEGRIASTFGNTSSPVAVNFSFTGTPDATLNVTNAGWVTNLLGSPQGSQGGFWGSPSVYVNNFPNNIASSANLGSVGAHELTHQLLGIGDTKYDSKNPDLMMFDDAPASAQVDAFLNPLSPLWRLSPSEASDLLKKCQMLHPIK
ncbi:MAG: RHS repeat-associated core domain-containing protein [Candidatus Acidiferrales bacterium]